MIYTVTHFYSCPTCKFREKNNDCDFKRTWHVEISENCFCSDWQSRENIKSIYHKIAALLVKLGYYNY